MSIMFSNRRDISTNGTKSLFYRERAVYNSANNSGFFNQQTNPKRMETKLFLSVLSWIGVSSYIGGILLNLGTWKSDVLFFLAFLFGVVKFIRYSVKTWQDYRRTEIEIKLKRREIEEN